MKTPKTMFLTFCKKHVIKSTRKKRKKHVIKSTKSKTSYIFFIFISNVEKWLSNAENVACAFSFIPSRPRKNNDPERLRLLGEKKSPTARYFFDF